MSALRRSGAGSLAACGIAVAGLALAGCSTTQDKSAALQRKARAVDAPGKVALGRPDPAVRLLAHRDVRTKAGTAVVVELQNTGPRALLRVPVALRLQAGGKQTYSNDGEGGDELLLRVPVLPPKSRVTWVNANVPATTDDAKLEVILGAPTRRSRRPAESLRVTAVKRNEEDFGEDGVAVTGVVHNDLRRAQTEVPVYVTVRDGDRLVAAGATRIDTIAARSTATFEALMVGDGRRGRLAAEALPTKLQKTTRSSR